MPGRATGTGAADSRCPACRAPVIGPQWVGRTCALRITADAAPITPQQEAQLKTPDRLTWCLNTGRWTAPELRWRCWTPPGRTCRHPVVITHQCPGPPQQGQLFDP